MQQAASVVRGAARRGYTLVEVLVAAMVMSIVIVAAWQVFRVTARMNEVSQWQSARQTELRVGLQMVRDDLARACYPTAITRTSSAIVDQATTGLRYKSGASPWPLTNGSSGTFLEFWICTPQKPGVAESRQRCRLDAEGRRLRYTRLNQTPAGQPAQPDFDRVIVNDVVALAINVNAVASAEYTMSFCTIAISCQHPRGGVGWEDVKVTQSTGTKVEVAAAATL